jgi:hypothetical protein
VSDPAVPPKCATRAGQPLLQSATTASAHRMTSRPPTSRGSILLGQGNSTRAPGRDRRLAACLLSLFALILLLAVWPAEAVYRLTFHTGASIVVHGYDDLGDDISYPLYGGTVTVPKASIATIEELPPPPTPPAPQPAAPLASPPAPVNPAWLEEPPSTPRTAPQGRLPPAPSFRLPWQRAGDAPRLVGTVRSLGVVALIVALVAVVIFLVCATTRLGEEWGGNVTDDLGATTPDSGSLALEQGRKRLGIVLIKPGTWYR